MERLIGLNLGSGQCRFESVTTGPEPVSWTNLDIVSREGQVPDVVADGTNLPFKDNTFDFVVLQHTLEHYNSGKGNFLIEGSHRVLKPEGSLIVTVPDLWKLADRWVNGGDPPLTDFLFLVNIYGAYQGREGDLHRWGFTQERLEAYINSVCDWDYVTLWNGAAPVGSKIARDWWICEVEGIK